MLLRITLVTKCKKKIESNSCKEPGLPRPLWISACCRRGVIWWLPSVTLRPVLHKVTLELAPFLASGCSEQITGLHVTYLHLYSRAVSSSLNFQEKKNPRFHYDPTSEGLLPGVELRSREWSGLARLPWTVPLTHSPGRHERGESASRMREPRGCDGGARGRGATRPRRAQRADEGRCTRTRCARSSSQARA